MNGPSTFQLVAAAANFILMLVWAIVAQKSWASVRRKYLGGLLTRPLATSHTQLLALLAGVVALFYFTNTLWWLIPRELHLRPPAAVIALYVLATWCGLVGVALLRHASWYLPIRDERPGLEWLAGNYGPAMLVGGLPVVFPVYEQPWLPYFWLLHTSYLIAMLVLVVRRLARVARRGFWRPGAGAAVTRRADVLMVACGLLALGAWLIFATLGGAVTPESVVEFCLEMLIAVPLAVPLAARMLGEVVRGVLMAVALLGAAAAVYLGARTLEPLVGPDLRYLFELGTSAAFVLVLVSGHVWVRGALDRLVFRRRRRRQADLQIFMSMLSPELGARECCRRALAELSRILELRGAGIFLARDEQWVVHGDFALAPLRRVWSRHAVLGLAPERGAIDLAGMQLPGLPAPLREALVEASVVWVLLITSPRERWGYLFVTTSLLRATLSEGDAEALDGFGAQLALVLDGADLLARAVSVERSLAHAEKLAAIGELSARIAHDIRNPVTAARSLAQQLMREPGSPFGAEHRVILDELERVERQVAALLRSRGKRSRASDPAWRLLPSASTWRRQTVS
jgi:signal transduction histidine kinase